MNRNDQERVTVFWNALVIGTDLSIKWYLFQYILLLDKFVNLPTFNIRLFTKKTWRNRIEMVTKVVCKNFIMSSLCTYAIHTKTSKHLFCWSVRPVKQMKFPIWTFLSVFLSYSTSDIDSSWPQQRDHQ